MLAEFRKSQFDWILLISVLCLILIGLVAVYSATHGYGSADLHDKFIKQLVWIVIGLFVALLFSFIPFKLLFSFTYPVYGVLLFLLLLLELLPAATGSADRWLNIAGFQFQPSELLKPFLVFTLARYLSDEHHSLHRIKKLLIVFALVLLPFALVLKQPDLGTALTFIFLLLPILYWQGLSLFVVFIIIAPIISFFAAFNFWTFTLFMLIVSLILIMSRRGAKVFWSVFVINIMVGVLAPFLWNHLHSYQQKRVLTFLGLISDPQGVGYQIIQSKVAIGSGGLFGKGFLHGTQTQLRFLPAQHTDFIFSVFAEEFGFLGTILLLGLFAVLLWRGVVIASYSKSPFISLCCIGIVAIFVFQIFVNIGMTLGIMPVTGMPLPFLSYGGSSMLTSMIMIGVLLNASKNI